MSLLVLAAAAAAPAPVDPTSFQEILDPVAMPAEAIADPCTPAPGNTLHCTTIASKKIAGVGRVDIRKITDLDGVAGYGVEVVIVTDDDGMFVMPVIAFGQISSLTKTNDATKGLSVAIRALDESTTGVELDYRGELTPNWKDTFKAYDWRGSILIACEAKDGTVFCKALQVGGAFGECRATGWHGRDAQIRCDRAIRL